MKLEEMFREEPEPLNENDPAVQEELFEELHSSKTEPNCIVDKKLRLRYISWLKARKQR